MEATVMSTATPSLASPAQPRAAVRVVVSALVLFHLLAVFMGPFAMPPATSELATSCAWILQPYVEGLSLANGYRFFAPEPGPSHLVRYEITLADGTRKEGAFPDRRTHKPRLLYHRYFMLTEFLNTLDNPEAPRERVQAYAQGYARHLADEYQAKSVKVYLDRHYVPRMSEVREGMRLSDKALYEALHEGRPLATFERDEP
jgi:hypothetical protein